jgi:tetratricopeptide (TPR) repeat protein
VWNLFSDAGREVAVVGWWATWPAETVRGSIVSDHVAYHFLFEDAFDDETGDRSGLVSPPELWSRVSSFVQQPSDVGYAEIQRFASVGREEFDRDFTFKDDLAQLRWILSTTKSYASIGYHLWTEQRPDLLMLYIEGTDSASHLFGHLFRQSTLVGTLAEQQRKFGRTVEEMYVLADEIVGKFMDRLDPDTVLVVLSDHGFGLGASLEDPSKAGDLRRVSADAHEDEGVLFMYGEPIVPGVTVRSANLLDIAPTILALSGLSASNEMPGRVLREALKQPHRERRPSTYENSTQVVDAAGQESPIDDAILEHLRSLGYLDTSSPATEKNLAASAFSAGRYEEAASAFRSLIATSGDDPSLYVGLAGSLGALGDYAAALDALSEAERIDPLQPEIYHNRAVVYERQNRTGDAIHEYEKALRFSSHYEPSRSALMRLTGSNVVRAPRNDSEREALDLAQTAERLSKNGYYEGAWSTIEMAVQTGRSYVVVFQYEAYIA